MPRPGKESNVADVAIAAVTASEEVLLHIGDTFHNESNGKQDDAGNVAACAKGRLDKVGDLGGIQDGHGQRACPNPQHLAKKESVEEHMTLEWRGTHSKVPRFAATHKTQKPRKDQNLSRLSSKRSSLPVLMILNNKKPERRAAHAVMKTEATTLRVSPLFSLNDRVSIASKTKLVPPAKSVSLSNLRLKAIAKKKSW